MNWKSNFPALYNTDIVYCDNAATTHKPQSVIDAIYRFYAHEYAPIYRGVYTSAENATQAYENVRMACAIHIGASSKNDIVFTKSATEGINIVAWSWAWHNLKPGDEIVISELEHHAHFVTWQQFAQAKGCHIRYLPVTSDGDIDEDSIDTVIHENTALVAISEQSNVIGLSLPVERVVQAAKRHGARVVCDATQLAPRAELMVQTMQYDFCVFSPHKMLGPTGLGVLYVAPEHHDAMTPYMYGGGMVYKVTHEELLWRDMPYRCEAGSPPSAQVIGFGAALRYLQSVDFARLREHEAALCRHIIEEVQAMPGMHVVGPTDRISQEGHMVSLYHDSIDAQDIALYLDSWNICVRSGHHCAQPLHTALHINNTVRISLYGYNTLEDVQKVILALNQLLS